MSIREMFDFVTDITLSDAGADARLEEIQARLVDRESNPVSAETAREEALAEALFMKVQRLRHHF